MVEETNSSSAVTEYLAHLVEVIRENEKFLRDNAEGTYKEVIGLINDAIDNVGLAVEKPEREKDYLEHSMAFFTYHVLMPFSHAVYMDLLAGNVPACFMELRLMLESLARCYLADSRHPEVPFFQRRLELLATISLKFFGLFQIRPILLANPEVNRTADVHCANHWRSDFRQRI